MIQLFAALTEQPIQHSKFKNSQFYPTKAAMYKKWVMVD
jgi:hypothetical protein